MPPSVEAEIEILNKTESFTIFLIRRTIFLGDERHSESILVNLTRRDGKFLLTISQNYSRDVLTVEMEEVKGWEELGDARRMVNISRLRVGSEELLLVRYVAIHSDYTLLMNQILSSGPYGYKSSAASIHLIPRVNEVRTFESLSFSYRGRKVIPEPLLEPLGCIIPVGATSQDGLGCGPRVRLSDLYEGMEDVLKELGSSYSSSRGRLNQYYSSGGDDLRHLSNAVRVMGIDKPVYGEHKSVISVSNPSIYPCEEHCYTCCDKWDEECRKNIINTFLNKYLGECFFCATEVFSSIVISTVIPAHILEKLAAAGLKKLLVDTAIGLDMIGIGYNCGACILGYGETEARCCLNWYKCSCHCVKIRW